MRNTKQLFFGIGVVCVSAGLLSFVQKDDGGKKKKYQVIHHSNGMVQEFDTILPMNSSYTVEQFLADRGVVSDNVKIIQLSGGGLENQHQIIFHETSENVVVNDANGEREEVKIICKTGENGEKIVQKFVNGQEVEMTEEEKNALQNEEPHAIQMHVADFENGEGAPESIEMNVQISVDMDDAGNMTVKKMVNGEEVPISPEEMERIENRESFPEIHTIRIENDKNLPLEWTEKLGEEGEFIEVKVEMEDNGTTTIQKFVNGVEVELSPEEMAEIQSNIGGTETPGMVFIKEIENDFEWTDSTGHIFEITTVIEEVEEIDSDNSGMRTEKIIRTQGGEDLTLVLVTENLDETTAINARSGEESMQINAPISVYPNPNNGTFTIAFQQTEKMKTSVEVIDAQGKIVFKEKLGNFSGDYRKELDLKSHGSGLYIVNVQQGDEISARKVIVE